MSTFRDWHRLFGLFVTDFCTDSPFEVELEMDLSLKQQYLDVVIVRKRPGESHQQWPDGMENLADHNLLSFKSFWEPLDPWAMDELLGHYVNYRKQVSPKDSPLVPTEHFRLFAVCARFPEQLQSAFGLQQLQPGVLQTRWGSQQVRIIVARDLPDTENNALIHLFSADPNKVKYGQDHFTQQSPETSSLIQQLVKSYQHKGVTMPYTMEEFREKFKKEFLKSLPDEERMVDIPPEKRMKGLTDEERMEGISPEKLIKAVPPEKLIEAVPPEKRLEGLSDEEILAILKARQEGKSDPEKP